MQNINSQTETDFIHFMSYGTVVLDCTRELIVDLFAKNGSSATIGYCIPEVDLYPKALELRIDKGTLLCYFNDKGKCEVSYVFFDYPDEVEAYIELCNQFFSYCSALNRWELTSSFIKYHEDKGDKYFGFYTRYCSLPCL